MESIKPKAIILLLPAMKVTVASKITVAKERCVRGKGVPMRSHTRAERNSTILGLLDRPKVARPQTEDTARLEGANPMQQGN